MISWLRSLFYKPKSRPITMEDVFRQHPDIARIYAKVQEEDAREERLWEIWSKANEHRFPLRGYRETSAVPVGVISGYMRTPQDHHYREFYEWCKTQP